MKRIEIVFDEHGTGRVWIDGEHAEGVWGLTQKQIEMPNGTFKDHIQFMVLVDFELEKDPKKEHGPLWQPYWMLHHIGRDGLEEINHPREWHTAYQVSQNKANSGDNDDTPNSPD